MQEKVTATHLFHRKGKVKNMKDLEDEINRSFKVLKEGDILEAPIIGISDDDTFGRDGWR